MPGEDRKILIISRAISKFRALVKVRIYGPKFHGEN